MSEFSLRSNGFHRGMVWLLLLTAGLTIAVGCNRDKIDSSKFQAAKSDDDSRSKPLDKGTKGSDLTPGKSQYALKNDGAPQDDRHQKKSKHDTGIATNSTGGDKKASAEQESGKTGNGGKSLIVGKTGESKVTRYAVPDGANEVLAFLRRMELQLAELIKDEKPDEDELLKIHWARMEGAEKLMHVPELRMQAVQIKLDAMIMMSSLGQEQMRQAALEFSGEVAKSQDPEIADYGLLFLLEDDFRAMTAQPDETTTNKFLDSLKSLIAKRGASSVVQEVVTSRIGELFSTEMRDEGIRALQVAVEGFQSNADPGVIENSKLLAEHLYVTKVGFDLASKSLSPDDPDSMERLVEATEKVLQNPDIGPVTLSEIRRQALYLESIHAYDYAKRIYGLMANAYKDHADANIGKEGEKLGKNGMTRIALVGQPLVVEGYTMLKQELDWSLFKNKVVIISFWSAGNQLCVPNLVELQEFVKANEDKALKLIAINVDDDPNAIVALFEGRNPPWTNIVTNDLARTGLESPMAVKCGIDYVPYSLLIDRAGKVADIDVIGADLEQRVANLLGEELIGRDGKKLEPAQREK